MIKYDKFYVNFYQECAVFKVSGEFDAIMINVGKQKERRDMHTCSNAYTNPIRFICIFHPVT